MIKDKEWAKNEVIKLWGRWMAGGDTIHELNNSVISIIDKLDEPEKVVVPKWVADNIESKKRVGTRLNVAMSEFPEFKLEKELGIDEYECNELYARAWLDGYEVEKEKLYIVQLPTNLEDDLIILDADGDIWKDSWPSRYKMTEKRIKEIDERYWPFAVEATK